MENEMDRAYSTNGREENGKGSLGRSKHRWMDNIKMDLEWYGLA
jgi:hypothetical protein